MTETPENYRAIGAMTADEAAYLLLEPKRDDPRLEPMAIPLPAHFSLSKAEDLAGRFNAGDVSAFRINPGQVLRGADIPTLHFQA